MDTETKNIRACHPTNEDFLLFYQAIKINSLDKVKSLLKNGEIVNAPFITAGSLKGYTALHIACMEGSYRVVGMLIKDLHADVNITANNGVQPVHLTVLLDHPEVLEILLQANANVDAEIGQDIATQHGKNHRLWCSDFGVKMSLLTYSVLCGQHTCIYRLLNNKANKNMISSKNKTLLMYAIERNLQIAFTLGYDYICDRKLVSHLDREFINHRDNDDRHAIHYLLHPSLYENFRYNSFEPNDLFTNKGSVLHELIGAGADINALINDDPDTLLLNMAAYRASDSILKYLLPYYDSISQSKALYYATLPFRDDQIKLDPTCCQNNLSERRRKSLELILKDLVNRRTFGLAIPDKEEELMDDLIENDETIAKIVHDYEQDFILGELKNQVIRYDDNRIIYYDLLSLSVVNKKLQKILRDTTFLENYNQFYIESEDYEYFSTLLRRRVKKAVKRIELLDKLKKLLPLRSAIPLPYELVLDIIEFLDDKNLEIFIDAFFSN